MTLAHKLLAFSYPILRLKSKLAMRKVGARLRVLLYHDVRPEELGVFDKQIKWLSKRWKFITPEEFELVLNHKLSLEHDSLLITFDDGFYSNSYVAEKVLDPLGIKAIFFVVSAFADLTDKESSYRFISDNIFPDLPRNNIPPHWYNMTWDILKKMLQSGHTIGGHTATHARLSSIDDFQHLNEEIVDSANVLEEMLGIKVKHFAYTFGDLDSINQNALKIANDRYDFIYSGMRGMNTCTRRSRVIRRDTVSPRDSLFLLGAFLEGGADSRYKSGGRTLDRWIGSSS